jgi:hypothetical protein
MDRSSQPSLAGKSSCTEHLARYTFQGVLGTNSDLDGIGHSAVLKAKPANSKSDFQFMNLRASGCTTQVRMILTNSRR